MAELAGHLQNVEKNLNMLIEDLESLDSDTPVRPLSTWERDLEDFRVKATTIRRILERFQSSDLSTRKYLRSHIDEEWTQLNESFQSLRRHFTSRDLF